MVMTSSLQAKGRKATDTVTSLLLEIMKWMEAHNDVLPAIFKHPTSQQKEETSLRYKYKNYRQKKIHLTDAQHALQEEIYRRATDQKDLDILEEIVRWSAKNNHKLPARSHRRQFGKLDNTKENNLAQKLRRLRNRKYLTPILQRRLAELVDKSHNSPTKATGRGAAAIHPRRRGKTAARFVFPLETLQQLPFVLAVLVPPCAHDEDDIIICLNSEDLRTDWRDCRLDLKEHFGGHRDERVIAEYGLAAYVAMPWPNSTDDDDENDETSHNQKAGLALHLGTSSSSSQSALQTPKVLRKRKLCIPTPKCRRLVGKQAPPEVWRTKKPSSLLQIPQPKKRKLWKGTRSGQDEENSNVRADRQEDRAGKKQDRTRRKLVRLNRLKLTNLPQNFAKGMSCEKQSYPPMISLAKSMKTSTHEEAHAERQADSPFSVFP